MKNRQIWRRAGFGLRGIKAGWQRERAFRTHLALAGTAVVALALVRPAPIWWAMLGLSLVAGLALELVNGALEALVDHLHPAIHPEVGAVKDMASGAALLVNGAATAIFAAAMFGQL
jgi:diacylglycerol kinase (ATP)